MQLLATGMYKLHYVKITTIRVLENFIKLADLVFINLSVFIQTVRFANI